MESLHQSFSLPATQGVTTRENSLSLYDRYGSLAYGIILQIIPEPKLAQTVLIDLFTCPEIKAYTESPLLVSSKLIRLARDKALKAKSARPVKSLTVSPSTDDNLSEVVFKLSFYEGYSIQEIAQKLHLSPASVLKMFAGYFKQHTVK